MPTPATAQDSPPTWSSSSGGAASSASYSSGSDSDPSSSSPLVPTSSSAPLPSSSPPDADAAPSSSGCRGTSSAPSRSRSPPPPSCAACRHQRRRCSPNCFLKPYFVTDDEPDKFQNALRVFGVKNLQRILGEVPPPRRHVCVQTIVYESNLRVADPVRGCCGVIQDLENQLMETAVELEVLRRRLESYRQMARRSQPPNPPPLAIQPQPMARRSGDGDMQTQGPYGVPPAADELAAAQIQLSATEMEPRSSQVQQPQLSPVRRP